MITYNKKNGAQMQDHTFQVCSQSNNCYVHSSLNFKSLSYIEWVYQVCECETLDT